MGIARLSISPLVVGRYTCGQILDLLTEEERKWKTSMELEAWKISWLTAPHLKRPLKIKKIFNYNQIVAESKKSESERVEELFMTSEEKKAKRQESLRNKILRSAEREKQNGG